MSIIDFNKLIINKAGKLVSFTNHSKVCVPISTEINSLPNIFLGAVNSKTDTVVNQSFKVKDNTKDYDGIKVVLSTKLDDVLVTIEKNSTGEYNWDFPILEKGKTIAYYIYTYKDDKIGNYTVKHVYEKGNTPVPPEPEDPIEDYQITGIMVDYETSLAYDPPYFNIRWDVCTISTFDENIQESKYEVTIFEDGVELLKEVVSYDEDSGYLDNGIQIEYNVDGNKVYTVDVIAVNSHGKRSKPASEFGKWEDEFKYYQVKSYGVTFDEYNGYVGYFITLNELLDDVNYKVYNNNVEIPVELDVDGSAGRIFTEALVPGTTYNLKVTATDKFGANAIPSDTFEYVAEDPLQYETYTYLDVTSEPYFDEGGDEIYLNCTVVDITNSKILKYDDLTLKIYDNNALNGMYPIDEDSLNADVMYTISEPSIGEHTIKVVLESNHGASIERKYQVEVNKCTLVDNSLTTDISISEYNEVIINFSTSNPILEAVTYELYDSNGNYYDVTDSGSGSGSSGVAIPLDNLYDNGYQPGDTVYFTLNITCSNHEETLTSDCDIQLPEN